MRNLIATFTLLGLLTSAACQAADEPLKNLDPGQRKVVEKYLDMLKGKDKDDIYSGLAADQAQLADLDGDGQAEMVLTWTAYFGNSQQTHVSVLAAKAQPGGKRRWHEAAQVDVLGEAIKVTLASGNQIVIDSLTTGPKDPRCCPTQKVHKLWFYRGGKLLAQ